MHQETTGKTDRQRLAKRVKEKQTDAERARERKRDRDRETDIFTQKRKCFETGSLFHSNEHVIVFTLKAFRDWIRRSEFYDFF